MPSSTIHRVPLPPDKLNHTIRKIVIATGAVTNFASVPGESGTTDGAGTAARFQAPWGMASDGAGNLFVADTFNNTIRKVVVGTRVVTTVVGSPDRMGVVLGPLPAGPGARSDWRPRADSTACAS